MIKKQMYGYGRIRDLITYLEKKHKNKIKNISTENKLDVLCDSLKLSFNEFDELISKNSPVLRTVKGHAFESFFDALIENSGHEILPIGGDDPVDRVVNGKSLQLKTFTASGTKNNFVQFKTHKTHGAKSEKESLEYYHHIDEFADYLIGLISYNPLKILVMKKEDLPRHKKDQSRILSPFKVNWKNNKAVNNWEEIGIGNLTQTNSIPASEDELLKNTSKKIGIKSEVIVNTILNGDNFRVWDMSIRGFARELAFNKIISKQGVNAYEPIRLKNNRGDKSDHALLRKKDHQYKFFQMKGLSINNCKFNGQNSTVAVETQLTRGRVNDHPTQSRLYLFTDWDYLIIGIDPPLLAKYEEEISKIKESKWGFYCIPVSKLDSHHKFQNRIKSLQIFKFKELMSFHIQDEWFKQWM